MCPSPKHNSLQPPANNLAASDSISDNISLKTLVLLVLGVTQYNEDWMIGDFTGFLTTFRDEFGITGDFFTAVDLDTYVKGLHSSIKFGRGRNERVVYDRSWADQGNPKPYTLISPTDLKSRTLAWLLDQAKLCDPTDTVPVIFIGHGDTSGKIMLGDNLLEPNEVSNAFAQFAAGVNVNAVTNACYEGVLVDKESLRDSQIRRYPQAATTTRGLSAAEVDRDEYILPGSTRSLSGRYHSSYFTEAFVKSLSNISSRIPSTSRGQATLESHLRDLEIGTYTLPPLPLRSKPTSFHDWDSTIPFELILNLDYSNFVRDHIKSSRARHHLKLVMQDMMSRLNLDLVNMSQDVTMIGIDEDAFGAAVRRVLVAITMKLDEHEIVSSDRSLYGLLEDGLKKPFAKARCLVEITFRIRTQSTVFEAFMMLQNQRLVSIDALSTAVDLRQNTDKMWAVMLALNSFEFFNSIKPLKGASHPFYEEPAMWLATMIVRGSIVGDLDMIVNFIWMSGILGQLNVNEYRTYWPAGRRLKVDSEALNARQQPRCFVAFVLPMDMGPTVSLAKVYDHVNDAVEQIEALFQSYFHLTPEQFHPARWVPKIQVPAVFAG